LHLTNGQGEAPREYVARGRGPIFGTATLVRGGEARGKKKLTGGKNEDAGNESFAARVKRG